MNEEEREAIEKTLAPYEKLEDNMVCPECGGPVVTSYGPGISCTYCLNSKCMWCDYDYDF